MEGRLISRSCTTGWTDWIHGELWLTTDALVRKRLSLATTIANRTETTVPVPIVDQVVPPGFGTEALATHPTNRCVRLDEIVAARLRRGVLSGRLAVRLQDGRAYKFLWLRADPAYEELSAALSRRLGPALVIG